MTAHALDEAWRCLDDTAVATRPASYPPPADPRKPTAQYLPAVPTFFGQRCCHVADRPVPPSAQHYQTTAFESIELTLDIGPQESAATPPVAAVRTLAPVPGTGEVASSAGAGVSSPKHGGAL